MSGRRRVRVPHEGRPSPWSFHGAARHPEAEPLGPTPHGLAAGAMEQCADRSTLRPSTGFTYLADGVFITDSSTPCSPESLLTRKENMLILIEEKWSCHLNSICFLIMLYIHILHTCFPGGSAGKESACNAGDQGSIPELGRSPGEGNGNPLQYSCLENSTDKGASWV